MLIQLCCLEFFRENQSVNILIKFKKKLFLGGATQNSIRTAQWVLGGPAGSTAYFGCVGKDEAAATLKKRAADDGVDARLVLMQTLCTMGRAVLHLTEVR